MRNPLLIGGCGATKPSLQKNPNFNGKLSLAEPSEFALARVVFSIASFHGMLMTAESLIHGLVERMEVITSFITSMVVPMTPTEEA